MTRWGELIRHDEEECRRPEGCRCLCAECDTCVADDDILIDPDKENSADGSEADRA
jgi:hypothetical protein